VLDLKPASSGLEIHSRATEMPGQKMGPFVRLGDGRLLTLHGTNAWFSADEGVTWQERPLFAEPTRFRIEESTLVRSSKGVLLAAFINMPEAHWTWDNKLCDAPGATLPTYVVRSLDDGTSWEAPRKLHDDWTGANRDMQELKTGRVIFTSMKLRHNPGHHAVLTYCSDDQGQTWQPSNVIDLGDAGDHGGVTEATIEELKDGRLMMFMRSNWMRFWQAESSDSGLHWHPYGPSAIAASCAPGTLHRLRSGRIVLVWNRPYPEGQQSFSLTGGDRRWSATPVSNHRGELSVAFSEDECKTWSRPVVIARKPGAWLAYPFVFERSPGELWITTMQGGVRLKLLEADFCGVATQAKPCSDDAIGVRPPQIIK
jgi:sialidase-1